MFWWEPSIERFLLLSWFNNMLYGLSVFRFSLPRTIIFRQPAQPRFRISFSTFCFPRIFSASVFDHVVSAFGISTIVKIVFMVSTVFYHREHESRLVPANSTPWTQSYKENFGINLLYANILALLFVKKSHVTALLPSDWLNFWVQHYALPK